MRVAVLGCGSIGRRHLNNLKQIPDVALVAFEPVVALAAKTASELDIPVFSDLEEVWQTNPHACVIAAPTAEHVPLALEAARHGCHLLIEKPLAAELEGAQELTREIAARQLISMVGCNMRFHPGPQKVKQMLEQNRIGDVISARIFAGSYLPRWRPTQDYRNSYSASKETGGAILDCIHELDLALWYLGPARLVCAVQRAAHTLGLETDGLAEILLEHVTHVISSVHLNFVQRNYQRGCTIIGSEGTLQWEWNDHRVTVYGQDGEMVETVNEPAGWQLNQMYVDELSCFCGQLKRGRLA